LMRIFSQLEFGVGETEKGKTNLARGGRLAP